ncbi:unnamed protein product [Brassica oleracea var. botrytis]
MGSSLLMQSISRLLCFLRRSQAEALISIREVHVGESRLVKPEEERAVTR